MSASTRPVSLRPAPRVPVRRAPHRRCRSRLHAGPAGPACAAAGGRAGSAAEPACCRSRWTPIAPGSSTCRRTRRTSRSAPNFQRDIDERVAAEARYPELCKGIIDFKKVVVPQQRRRPRHPGVPLPAAREDEGPKGHAAMVWVHGGVHGNWGITMFPFVKEAVERGYVVIAPDYRGSIGYGEAYHQAIDYGGYEVDDVMSAAEYLKTLPHVDPDEARHHGLEPRRLHHAVLGVPREDAVRGRRGDRAGDEPRVPAVATRGRGYQWDFATQKRIQGLPFEKPDIYIERSPLYHVDKLQVPLLVHVATNDTRRELRRGPADRRRAAVAQAGPGRDEDVRRSGALGRERRPLLQPARRPEDAAARGFARRRSIPGTGPGRSSSGTLRKR